MRRFLCFMLAVCLSLLCGCAGVGGSFLDYQNNIGAATVTWEYGGKTYTAEVSFDGAIPEDPATVRPATVSVAAPEEIAGTTISFTPEGTTATVGGVTHTLPENMGREVYRIVRSLSLYQSEMKGAGNGSGTVTAVRFEVPMYGGVTEYDITYGEDKRPVSASVTWDGGEMTVTYGSFAESPAITSVTE